MATVVDEQRECSAAQNSSKLAAATSVSVEYAVLAALGGCTAGRTANSGTTHVDSNSVAEVDGESEPDVRPHTRADTSSLLLNGECVSSRVVWQTSMVNCSMFFHRIHHRSFKGAVRNVAIGVDHDKRFH